VTRGSKTTTATPSSSSLSVIGVGDEEGEDVPGLCPPLLWPSATSSSSRTVLAALDYAWTAVLVTGVVARTALAVVVVVVVVVMVMVVVVVMVMVVVVVMVMVMVVVVVVVVVDDGGGGGSGGREREVVVVVVVRERSVASLSHQFPPVSRHPTCRVVCSSK
jgi:hypothetical protein